MEKQVKGIILYTIERDGNLNGVYTNNHIPNARIFTETAHLIDTQREDETEIQTYNAFYFDFPDIQRRCVIILRITNGIYRATWQLRNGTLIFEGEGFLMNDRQIAISYWGV